MSTAIQPIEGEGVEWEMVTRFPWDGQVSLELRALSQTQIQITATTVNGCGSAKGSRVISFVDLRKALDALAISARTIERLDSK